MVVFYAQTQQFTWWLPVRVHELFWTLLHVTSSRCGWSQRQSSSFSTATTCSSQAWGASQRGPRSTRAWLSTAWGICPWWVFNNGFPLVCVQQWLALGECSAMTCPWWVFSNDLSLVSVQQWLTLGECSAVTCPWWVFNSDLPLVSVQQWLVLGECSAVTYPQGRSAVTCHLGLFSFDLPSVSV